MRIAVDGVLRATTGLNLRAGRGTNTAILAVLAEGALVHVVGGPSGEWVLVELWGWTADGERVFWDDDEMSGVKATLRGGSVGPSRGASEDRPQPAEQAAGEWRQVRVRGYVSTGFVTVVDGPKT